jgi:hypothetical protein
VLARSNQALIDDFQEHYSTRTAVGQEHGKKIGTFFDEAIIIQGVKSAHVTVVYPDGNGPDGTTAAVGSKSAPVGFKDGNVIDLALAADELDGDKLFAAIEDLLEMVELKDVDVEEGALFVDPTQYKALLRSENLINSDFNTTDAEGASVTRSLPSVGGVRILKTNRMSAAKNANTGHYLSNAGNANAYDLSADMAKTVALFLMPKALLAGETIPLTSDVYYKKSELQWYIDSYLSFAATPNRPEYAGVIKKA